MKKISILTLLLSFFYFFILKADDILIQPGEELFYEVSYIGVKLGSIKVITESNQKLNGKSVHKCKAFIDSYRGIPFVSLHAIFESWLDPLVAFSHKFAGNTKVDDGWDYHQIIFDYPNNKITLDRFKNKKKYATDNYTIKEKFNDGLSLFFFARKFIQSKRNVKVPTFIDKDIVSTNIYFLGNKESTEIDAVDYKVKTIYFQGKANWKGIYGLSGDFEGWFSDDLAAVPIKAKMKVYIGSVNIELISWKRKGWSPPKA